MSKCHSGRAPADGTRTSGTSFDQASSRSKIRLFKSDFWMNIEKEQTDTARKRKQISIWNSSKSKIYYSSPLLPIRFEVIRSSLKSLIEKCGCYYKFKINEAPTISLVNLWKSLQTLSLTSLNEISCCSSFIGIICIWNKRSNYHRVHRILKKKRRRMCKEIARDCEWKYLIGDIDLWNRITSTDWSKAEATKFKSAKIDSGWLLERDTWWE